MATTVGKIPGVERVGTMPSIVLLSFIYVNVHIFPSCMHSRCAFRLGGLGEPWSQCELVSCNRDFKTPQP